MLVRDSEIENRVLKSSIFNLESPEDIIQSNCLTNIKIKDGVLFIRKLLEDCLDNRIILFLAGFRYNQKTYIFNNYKETDEYININLPN